MRAETLNKVGQILDDAIIEQFALQGHKMTGAFEASLQRRNGVNDIECQAVNYGNFVNLGVRADQIRYPFAKARIDGLQNFVKHRITQDDKLSRHIAYAIAAKHAKVGMPTPESARFSQNGKRTDFIDDALEQTDEQITDIIMDEFLIDTAKYSVTGR